VLLDEESEVAVLLSGIETGGRDAAEAMMMHGPRNLLRNEKNETGELG
jgi:hypothetical protein